MPRLDNLLQTVADRDNPDYVEAEGPFLCVNRPWLGKGYYFWDNLIDRAHWWGNSHYDGKYMICQAFADINKDEYLDLAGNMEQLHDFENWYKAINASYGGEVKTVSFVIAKLIRDDNFPFKAIRVLSENCGGDEHKIPFVPNSKSFLNLCPPMQICIYAKDIIQDYHIIFPEIYSMDWCI